MEIAVVFVEQTFIMIWKHLEHKRLAGRATLKDMLIPMALILYWDYIFIQSNQPVTYLSPVYDLRSLPPLSSKGEWGIFQDKYDDDFLAMEEFVPFRNMYYSPNDNTGVNELMGNFSAKYPGVKLEGRRSSNKVAVEYESNLFRTWASLEFDLSDAQIAADSLITSETSLSEVTYEIRISPMQMPLPDSTRDDDVYQDSISLADAWANSGYLTIQRFIASHLATTYDGVDPDFEMDIFIQRYPRDKNYEKSPGKDLTFTRFMLWKWVASVLLTCAVILPVLGLAAQTVFEKESKMQDLLQISGLLDSAYWVSYEIAATLIGVTISVIVCLLLLAGTVFSMHHFAPYLLLLSFYSMALFALLMAFGFVVFRSEYYGLPAFLISIALCVAGDYMADDESISIGVKLFLGFVFPPLNLSMGAFTIETYIYHHGSALNYDHVDDKKNLASLSSIVACLFFSACFYLFVCWGMPFDWIFANKTAAEIFNRGDDAVFPCDDMDDDDTDGQASSDATLGRFGEVLLNVNDVYHVYPDGTRAVKGISFKVREGEVLSYLGANGAGKSTTMGMLCGTLDATFGDAVVNGFSITRDRSSARRNLGICMQQNVIWDDISIVDHLYLFARLRGMKGAALKEDVQNMMNHLGFPEKAHSAAGTLSGGQKRRLCVGISMVGGNSVVYLDEPTAGLDPVSRRQLWELVQLNRKGRAILLTTHFLDEADVLGDRIAIVKEGRMRAIGTSKFLKGRFGMGYLLRASLNSKAQPEQVHELISRFVPAAEVVSVAGTEFSIRLPKEASVVFASMFEAVDGQLQSLGIVNYGIETTTLEEVFIRIVNEDTDMLVRDHASANRMLGASADERDNFVEEIKRKDNKTHPLSEDTVKLLLTKGRQVETTELNTIHKQVNVLVWKRFFQLVRSKGQWMMNVIVPTCMIVISAIITYNIPTSILGDNPGATDTTYDSPFVTPVTGSSQAMATSSIEAAGVDNYVYVGDSYDDLYEYVLDNTGSGVGGNTSGAAVHYTSLLNATVMYNSSYPLWYAGLIGDILQVAISNVTQNRLVVNAVCTPLQEEVLGDQANLTMCFFFVACLIAGSLGSAISIVISGERVGLVKHQQLASGVSLVSYWLSNFFFDYLVAGIHALGLSFALYCARAYVYSGNNFGLIFGIGLLFNITAIYRFYVFSSFLSDIRMAQTFYFYGSLLSMFVLILVYSLTVYTFLGGDASQGSAQTVAVICTVFDPSFGYLFLLMMQNDFLGVRTQNGDATIASTSVNGNLILTIFLCAFGYLLALVYIENGFGGVWSPRAKKQVDKEDVDHADPINPEEAFDNVLSVTEEGAVESGATPRVLTAKPHARSFGATDPDVELEKARVQEVYRSGSISKAHNAIFVHRLNRTYYGRGTRPTKVAVKDLSLSIELGEIFGLLGANGAGKTTLLKMVSGLEDPSSGSAYINGYNIVGNRRAAQRSMGLCPQFDTLVERLTVRENLLFFARIKGIEDRLVEPVCEAFMAALNIKRYENKMIQFLSGGNRRKVSLAVALLGSPPTVYLDEPSTGLDPVASRLMWRLLAKIGETKSCAIVLTTHNMLECEAVCTRVGVMKIGELVCLGDSMHLRSVHGTGFLLEMHLKGTDSMEACKEFVNSHFAGAVLVDEHSTMLNFEVPAASVGRLSRAFSVLEEEKEALGVIDYAMSQSTLEQVFLKQIRPNEKDQDLLDEQRKTEARVPRASDYIMAYFILLLAFFIPGLHHFYLGNFWRGMKYLFTINELWVGWFLDIFELHVLVKKSVEQHGSQKCCEPCQRNCCCCCCSPKIPDKSVSESEMSEVRSVH